METSRRLAPEETTCIKGGGGGEPTKSGCLNMEGKVLGCCHESLSLNESQLI